MPTPLRTYLVREAVLVVALNAALNAAYTWWPWRHAEPLRLLGPGGIVTDLATTPVAIAALSTLLGTAVVRRKVGDGRIVAGPARPHPVLRRLPRGVPLRAAAAAALAALLLALPLLALLPVLGDGVLTPGGAVGTKAAITVALTLLIVPTLTLAALADVRGQAGRATPA